MDASQKQFNAEIQKLSHKRRLLKDEEDVIQALLVHFSASPTLLL